MGFLGSMFGGFGNRSNDDGGDNTGQSPLASSGMGAMNRFQGFAGLNPQLKQPGGMAGGQQGMPPVGMGGGMSGGLSRGLGNMASGFGAMGSMMGQKAPMTEQAPSGQQFGQGNMPGGMAMSMGGPTNTGMAGGGIPIGGQNAMQRFAQHMGQGGQQLADKFGAGNAYKPPVGFAGNQQTAPINQPTPDFFRNNTGFRPPSNEPIVRAPEGEGFERSPGLQGRSQQELDDFFKQMTDPNRARLMVEPQQRGGIF